MMFTRRVSAASNSSVQVSLHPLGDKMVIFRLVGTSPVVGTLVETTIDLKISLHLGEAPSEEGVAKLKDDVKRCLSHMLNVAKIDGAYIRGFEVRVPSPAEAVSAGRRAQSAAIC